MSDTPETDKIAHAGLPERAYISEMTHKSRKLERERDEARKLARFEIDGALSYLPEDLVIQHDDAFAAMALTFAKLNQEVSKLRAEVERLKSDEAE